MSKSRFKIKLFPRTTTFWVFVGGRSEASEPSSNRTISPTFCDIGTTRGASKSTAFADSSASSPSFRSALSSSISESPFEKLTFKCCMIYMLSTAERMAMININDLTTLHSRVFLVTIFLAAIFAALESFLRKSFRSIVNKTKQSRSYSTIAPKTCLIKQKKARYFKPKLRPIWLQLGFAFSHSYGVSVFFGYVYVRTHET
mmetsp:Transcript_30938/g.49647  ORF Transcript_30938/g.49647 Transcript_30938/m.49647 type:complete len:201 (+) Transcript_30938:5473-6075(+)